MKFLIFTFFVFSLNSFAKWKLHNVEFKGEKIRTGILYTTSESKGDILYLPGLGDSMMNHSPLFNHLSKDGFNIISFDYMGQGGSTGSMNKTTISNIGELAQKVWSKYSQSKKLNIIGWSTGGLAAYRIAYKSPKKVNSVVLIAPGIAPKLLVGDTSISKRQLLEITEKSLTQREFKKSDNPHTDIIRPNSPLKVPFFTSNLLKTSIQTRFWKITKEVKGLVLLSSPEDTYVDAQATIKIIKKNATHFDYYQYGQNSLHELDNEIESVASDLRKRITNFFN